MLKNETITKKDALKTDHMIMSAAENRKTNLEQTAVAHLYFRVGSGRGNHRNLERNVKKIISNKNGKW